MQLSAIHNRSIGTEPMDFIQEIPFELLSRIFLFTLPPEPSSQSLLNYVPRATLHSFAPFTLQRVCSRWNNVAIATHRLWTTIFPEVVMRPSLLRTFLRRSGNVPLSIYINYVHECKMLTAIVALISPNLHRCRRLLLFGFKSSEVYRELFPPDSHCTAPILEDLILAHPFSDHNQRFGTLEAPSLRSIAIACCPSPHLESSLKSSFPSVRDLVFLDTTYHDRRNKTDTIIPFLSQFPNLENSKLFITQQNEMDSVVLNDKSIIHKLDKIHTLNIILAEASDTDVCQLLSSFDLPSLRHLHLRLGYYFSAAIFSSHRALLQQITHLYLESVDLSITSIPTAGGLRSIEELKVRRCIGVDKLLTDRFLGRKACPNLTSLSFQNCGLKERALIDIYESRRHDTLKAVDIFQCEVSNEIMEWIEEETKSPLGRWVYKSASSEVN
jgi:F-box-like